MSENKDVYSLESVMRQSIKNALVDLRTVHPCKIRKVRENGTVDVELLIHASYSDGSNKALPPVTQMPVLFQGNSDITISFPVNVGDEGLALFAERDISKFMENSEGGPPNALRMHDLSDGMFFPTPISTPNRVPVKTGTLLMSNKGTEIEITDGVVRINGDLEINGDTTTTGELTADGEVTAMAAVPLSTTELSTHGHCYSPGPGTPIPTSPPGACP